MTTYSPPPCDSRWNGSQQLGTPPINLQRGMFEYNTHEHESLFKNSGLQRVKDRMFAIVKLHSKTLLQPKGFCSWSCTHDWEYL